MIPKETISGKKRMRSTMRKSKSKRLKMKKMKATGSRDWLSSRGSKMN